MLPPTQSLSLFVIILAVLMPNCDAKVDLYLSSEQTEALYGIQTDGLYYVRHGKINQYAMTFQHQASSDDQTIKFIFFMNTNNRC